MNSEQKIRNRIEKDELIIYLDECAAGVLCGELYVCGLIITNESLSKIKGINDSKKLTEKKRAELYHFILKESFDYEIVKISPEEVDKINIFQARMEGFRRAIEILHKRTGANYAVIDGNKKPQNLSIETDFLIKADLLIPGVSCASILAKHKHTLDIYELSKNEPYSKYGLDKHKGYGTKLHMEALEKYGPIKGFHRYSYKPVKNSIK